VRVLKLYGSLLINLFYGVVNRKSNSINIPVGVFIILFSNCVIIRYYLKGDKKGQWDMFISGLPGIVDNITPSKKYGGFWFAVPFLRQNALLDFSSQLSWIQSIGAKVWSNLSIYLIFLL